MKVSALVALYLLGQTRATRRRGGVEQRCPIQPRPLYVLAYLALNWQRAHRREELQALFWPDKSPKAAANNLHQALWHLRQALPSATLCQDGDCARWNPSAPPWVDALAFETALDSGDMDAALSLYTGALLPDCYDEWAQLERERLRLRYLTALETRAHQQYQARGWDAARSDASTLLADDPLNEAAVRLALACHWALNQRESARRLYDAYRQRVRAELHTDPLPETTMLYQRILRGEAHPDQSPTCDDATTAAQAARFSLLETLGAFRQGLEQATTWVAQADAATRAEALRWQGVFYLRLGKLADARAALIEALALTPSSPRQVVILSILATTETGLGEYASAEAHFTQALHFAPLDLAVRVRLLSALGGLQGRMGHHAAARRVLEEAVSLARALGNSAPLAMTSGNLGILLLGQRETTAAERALREALAAARQADAHWLTAHIQGHLGVLDQDRGDYESAAHNYLDARADGSHRRPTRESAMDPKPRHRSL
jgi:DNA-binding SARP family transcriptional activator